MIASAKDVQAIRGVAINVSPEAIEPFIDDVEKQDVLPVIGADLYFEIEANRDDPKYKELLYGGTFSGCNCGTQYTRGLVAAIAYLAYSRMLVMGNIQYTAFGAVKKETQYGSPAGEVELIRAADSAKKIGFAILQTVAAYIQSSPELFGSTCCAPKRVTRPRFISISKKTL